MSRSGRFSYKDIYGSDVYLLIYPVDKRSVTTKSNNCLYFTCNCKDKMLAVRKHMLHPGINNIQCRLCNKKFTYRI